MSTLHSDGYVLIYDKNEHKSILEHRYIMEQFLGRKLKTSETVHHKDHDKTNNSIENLEVIDNSEHVRMHNLEHGKQYVKLKCPECGKIFDLPKNQSFLQKNNKYPCTCCCNSCRGKLYKKIQVLGLTDEIQQQMNENLIEEYTFYQEMKK